MIGIELFAGAGGMSCGAREAGLNVEIAVELKEATCKTYALNHPDTRLIAGDIRKLSENDFRITQPCRERIVFGGPPCQGFSTSNQRTRTRDNPNNWLLLEFIRIVDIVKPQWVVFENVAGILQTDGGSFAACMRNRLRRRGYKTSEALLNAVDFGVPQRRTRFFMVGARDRRPPDLSQLDAPGRIVTVDDAIADLPFLSNGDEINLRTYRSDPKSAYAASLRAGATECGGHLVSRNADHIVARYPFIKAGGNWRDIPESMMDTYLDRMRCHTGIYRRLRADEPSVVLGNFRKNMLIHPSQHRGLSVREAARLQSFPDRYQFCGSIGQQQQQVGNAVPPLLARAVFAAMIDAVGTQRK